MPAPMTTTRISRRRRRPRTGARASSVSRSAAWYACSARPRNSSSTRLNVVACSTMKPCAAPLITTSSAVGIRSARSSLSPRGVRMSWLPTRTRVGTSISGSRSMSSSCCSVAFNRRVALRGEGVGRPTERERAEPTERRHDPAERARADHPSGGFVAHGADAPFERRVAPADRAAPRARDGCAPPCRPASTTGCAPGYFTATIWLIAPPIDAPTTWAVSTPASSSTAIASSAICSSE